MEERQRAGSEQWIWHPLTHRLIWKSGNNVEGEVLNLEYFTGDARDRILFSSEVIKAQTELNMG